MTTIRRLILGAALTGAGIILTLTAGQDDAHAADKPAIMQPGGLLDHVTGLHDHIPGHHLDPHPGKPRKRDEARRDEDPRGDEGQAPTLPLLDQLVPEPEPEPPAAEPPAEPAPTPAAPIGDVVGVVEGIVVDVVAPVLPALPAAPAVPALPVTLPATGPAPLPDADAPPATTAPPPVTIGPVPADPQAAPVPDAPVAASAALEVPPCGHTRPEPANHSRGTVRRSSAPVDATLPPHGGCPGVPGHVDHALTLVAMKPPSGSGVDLIAEQAAQFVTCPALARLDVLRPRSHMPAGPAHRIDPRPA